MGEWFCQGTMRMDDGRIIECGWEDLLGGRTYRRRHHYHELPWASSFMSIGVVQTCSLPWTAV